MSRRRRTQCHNLVPSDSEVPQPAPRTENRKYKVSVNIAKIEHVMKPNDIILCPRQCLHHHQELGED